MVFKLRFHTAVWWLKDAASIAGTISTYMETISPGTAGSRNYDDYGTVMTWTKVESVQFFSILVASSAMKFIWKQAACGSRRETIFFLC